MRGKDEGRSKGRERGRPKRPQEGKRSSGGKRRKRGRRKPKYAKVATTPSAGGFAIADDSSDSDGDMV